MTDWHPEVSPARGVSRPGVLWLLGMSAWLVPVVAGLGSFTWLGFLVIGLALVRIPWLVAAGAYGAAAFAVPLLPDVWPELLGRALLFAVGVVHALVVNPRWLWLMWERRATGQRMLGRSPAAGRTRAPLAGTVAAPGAAAPATHGGPAAATATGPATGAASAGSPPSLVDPRTATVDELAALPAMGRARAEHVVLTRTTQSIGSSEDLATLLQLQPHEIVVLRPRLVFPPPPAALPPAHEGRILDV